MGQYLRALLLATNVMIGNRHDLIHSLPSDAITLLDRQRMLSRLNPNFRPHTYGLSANHCFKMERFRITWNGVRKPTEIGLFAFSSWTVPTVQASLEVFLT
jgi:hypothetical protein